MKNVENKLKTVKQFARENGITVQAVYKKIHQKKNRGRLNGHIVNYQGMQCLDEIAQEILSPCAQNKEVEMKLTRQDIVQNSIFSYLNSSDVEGLDNETKQIIGFHLINFTRNFME